MKLAFGSDHAGYELRKKLESWAAAQGHEVQSLGADSAESYDYPEASNAVVSAIRNQEAEFGVLICGSGIGVSIRANRFRGIRAALCCGETMAALARRHNDANVLCLGARLIDSDEAIKALSAFLETDADPAERHRRRVNQLDANVE